MSKEQWRDNFNDYLMGNSYNGEYKKIGCEIDGNGTTAHIYFGAFEYFEIETTTSNPEKIAEICIQIVATMIYFNKL